MSHTGFLGGSYAVAQGAFTQAGLIAVDSYEALFAVAKALATQPRARGNHVAMISNGAGTMVQAIDLLAQHGLQLSELSDRSLKRLAEVYPSFYQIANPVDVTGSASSKDYDIGMTILLEDPHVDIIMPWFVFQDTPLEEDIVQIMGNVAAKHDKPILVGAMGGPYTHRMSQAIEAAGVPVFHSVRDWVSAAQALAVNPVGEVL
jgi:3-hydroxypropionyl-CoA synthetase (ADP-forming)